ncbi:hypothetical protein L1887_17407 [Cichorium endivia]|nr:hypothetical protein L1887_17407 [Cichorium endivia]
MMVSNSSESTTMLYAQKRCHSIYGFLPCADTVQEGVVLMVIYTYLMMLGEEWIDKGSPALFGDGALGASVFRVLKALPKIVIIIVSGVLATTSDAQHKVAFAVSFYAGSTVITLTLIWGLRIILYRDKLRGKVSAQKSDDKQHSSVRQNSSVRQKLSVLCDTGVNIDKETGKLAVIMLLSLIPFATVELVLIFNSRIIILLALIVSGVSLVLYFAYQIWSPLIKARSLAYLMQENLQTRFFYHVKRLAKDHLDEQGDPKKAFESIFERADIDKDNSISDEELEIFIQIVLELEKDQISKDAKEEILTHLDEDGSGKIDRSEFEKGCTKWSEKWKNVANNSNLVSKNIRKQAKHTRNKLTQIENIMPRILMHLLKKHQLVTEGGKANRENIEGLFSNFDDDKNQEIQRTELKKFIETFQFGVSLEVDAILDAIMNDFDNDADSSINKKEFVDGFVKWIEKAIKHDPTIKDPKYAIAKLEKDSWGEIDAYMKREPKARIMYAIFGVGIISVISGAFVQSVVQFSNAAHISFLFTSFVIAPLAMNTRMIISALLEAASHVSKNASLTISEIYSGLVMDNLMGLATLLATVYIKGLSWRYKAEVVTIMMPCTIVGLFSLRRDTYPLWASLCAILLYPVSIYVHYVLH